MFLSILLHWLDQVLVLKTFYETTVYVIAELLIALPMVVVVILVVMMIMMMIIIMIVVKKVTHRK